MLLKIFVDIYSYVYLNLQVSILYRIGCNIWFSLELCSGGSVAELARQLVKRGRRLIDDQIAYIVKEVLHALIYLQVGRS
jgi:serine/threonine protein kinase